jgi:hypothetical protein
MLTTDNKSTMSFPERSKCTTEQVFTWDEVRELLDKEVMRRAEYIARILETLQEKFGAEVLEIAAKVIYDIGYEKGEMRARLVNEKGQDNDLTCLAQLISHKMSQLYLGNSVEIDGIGLSVREDYCPLPRKWKQMGLPDAKIISYCLLFDQVDKGMVEGFNHEFEAELSGCKGLAENGFCEMIIRAKE